MRFFIEENGFMLMFFFCFHDKGMNPLFLFVKSHFVPIALLLFQLFAMVNVVVSTHTVRYTTRQKRPSPSLAE